jgi:hypothetical protein
LPFTPTASGGVLWLFPIELAEDEDLSRLIGACEFLDWIEKLPEGRTKEEKDQDYYAELERRGLTELDVDTITHGNWRIITKDNEEHKIHWPKFDRAGFITWRW